MTLHLRSLLYLALASVLWSASGIVIKTVDWTPLAIASVRGLFAAATVAFLGRKSLSPLPPSPAQIGLSLLLALLALATILATKLTTAANAVLLQYTAPVWVALLAPFFLGERTRPRDWLFIALTFCGMALFLLDALSPEGARGILVAAAGGVIYAGVILILRRMPDEQRVAGTVYANALLALLGVFAWRPPWPSAEDLLVLALAGIFQIGLAFYLFTLASRGVTALEMVLVTVLEPLLNPLWVYLGVGELPGAWTVPGGILVLAAVSLWGVLNARPSSRGRP
jgi:drug/metabolite transporter (DMT)-like permease